MKKGNEFICIQKTLEDEKLLEVQFLNGKIDTLKRKLIKRRVNVTLDIQTRTDTLSNVTITEIQPTFYKISQNEKLFNLNIVDVISINEHILEQDTMKHNRNREMIGIGLGLPYGYINYDKMITGISGFRANIIGTFFGGALLADYYFNFPSSEKVEHNFTLTSGIFRRENLNGGTGYSGVIVGTSYDIKIHFLMIKIGVAMPIPINGYIPILPNLSIGYVYKL